MNKYAVLAGLVIVILVTGLMGAHFGYTVNGVPQGAEVDEDEPIAYGAIAFLVSMVSFRVDNMPIWLSAVFIFMAVMTLVLAGSLVRGTE